MKRILILSLAVNLALLALMAWWRKPHQVTLPAREFRGETQPDLSAFRQRQARAAGRMKTVARWKQLESGDVRQFISTLRDVGCPEATIRDIVTLRIGRAYRERLLEYEMDLVHRLSNTQNLGNAEWQMLWDKNQDLRDEMKTELESVLGEDWATLASSLTGIPFAGDDLNKVISAEKRAQLRDIDKQFRHDFDKLQMKQMLGGLEKDEAATLRTLERQKRDALAAVLSPYELEEYLYRNSPAADYVRRNLPEAKSEAEYRTMVKLALEMELSQKLDSTQNVGLGTGPEESNLEGAKRREEFARRLRELLGEERVAEQQAAETSRANTEAKAREVQDKQRMQQEVMIMAVEVGANPEHAKAFFDRLEASKPVLSKNFEAMEKALSGNPEEKQKQMKAAIIAELNSLAIETMGDKGPAVVEKMMKSQR